MLEEFLATLGLTDDEARVYLGLLETGTSAAGALAAATGLPRPTVYGHLDTLLEHGLITRSVRRGIKQFSAEEPEKISQLFDRQIESLSSQKRRFENILPKLESHPAAQLSPPKFRIFEGGDGLEHVLRDMLLYRNIETLAYWPIKSMLEILSADFFRFHNHERIKNRIYTRAIWPKNQIVSTEKYLYLGSGPAFHRDIRIAPEAIDFTMGYWIYRNKVAFVSSRKERFGFLVESAELVVTLRSQFEVLWSISEPHS